MRPTIVQVTSRRDLNDFIKLPWTVYRGDKHWVPPLILERREFLNPRKNPFFDHAKVRLLLAREGKGAAIGRIVGIVNHNHIQTHQENAGFFGLFESLDDQVTANLLFDAAAAFLRAEGMEIMRGPENMSVNDDLGLLIDGFDYPPVIMMPYNPPYYVRLVETYGFSKSRDLFAYSGVGPGVPERLTRGVELIRKRYKFRVRPLDFSRFAEEERKIHRLYNEAWQANWGAVPMTDAEFHHMASSLKLIADPELCLIAEVGDEPAGFSLALPDLNQALTRLNGRLLPFGIFKLLWYGRKIDGLRVIAMGVKKEFRHMGIDTCFYHETYLRGYAKGIVRGEMSWVLEDNALMNRALVNMGLKLYKRYRLYDYELQPRRVGSA